MRIYVLKMRYGVMDWINLAQDMNESGVILIMVGNVRIYKMRGIV
jgi:hypothetical protein